MTKEQKQKEGGRNCGIEPLLMNEKKGAAEGSDILSRAAINLKRKALRTSPFQVDIN